MKKTIKDTCKEIAGITGFSCWIGFYLAVCVYAFIGLI